MSRGLSHANVETVRQERVIVLLNEDAGPPGSVAGDLAAAHGGVITQVYGYAISGFAMTLPAPAVDALRRDGRVALVEPDQIVTIADHGQHLPTGADRIEADRLGSGVPDTDVDVAIIDTGINYPHKDLNTIMATDCTISILFPGCFGGGIDGNGHGTHVAGIAAARDNGVGVVGAAPGARLWSVKVLDDSGSGFLSWLIGGIDVVAQYADQIEVANMSLTGEFSSASLDASIANAVNAGVVFAVAAGNSASDASTFSPASHPDVITVSAVADFDGRGGGVGSPTCRSGVDDTFADFSNYGSVVDMAAPGVCIESTYLNDSYTTFSGTSMASPYVAGSAARYLAAVGLDPTTKADVDSVKAFLLGAALPQSHACGFSGDPDGLAEPLLFVNVPTLGGDGTCDDGAGSVNGAPAVAWSAPTEGETVTGPVGLSFTATDPEGEAVAAEWSADGGATWVPADGTGPYTGNWDSTSVGDGTHTLTARATDGSGNVGTSFVTVNVENVDDPPVAAFTFSCTGLECSFDASSSSDPEGGSLSFSWNFGDSSSGSSETVAHTYAGAGTYTVTLTVSDGAGNPGTDSQDVTVSEPVPTGTMHLGDLRVEFKGNRVQRADAYALVLDENGTAVSGATVTGVWLFNTGTDIVLRAGSGTTRSSGEAKIGGGRLPTGTTDLIFCVGGVSHNDYVYDPLANNPLAGCVVVLVP